MDPKHMPDHWKILLDGYEEGDGGDVLTRDGEVLGTWRLINGAIFEFTPEGAQAALFVGPHLWPLALKIWEWHQWGSSAQG